MMDYMVCPHCGETQDQTEIREWHSLAHSDSIDTECDSCKKPIRVTANLYFEVTEIEE